jgi:MoCo/4Fe-4S cofactor protein with predicted Tat translocation signal
METRDATLPPRGVPDGATIDLTAIRAKLAKATGRQYWRSLDELAETDEFKRFLEAEFPREASVLDTVGRREFLKLMGASLALAGLNGCTKQPPEKIVPYVKQPELIIPGVPLFFATATPLGGFGTGVLVESHMGRPTKIEGNPEHPASLGATDALTQGTVLQLYDPDRSEVVRNIREIRPWGAFLDVAAGIMEKHRPTQGARVRFLTETISSPALRHQLEGLLKQIPKARWCQYSPVSRDQLRAGALLAFGEPVDAVYNLDKADVIVSLDADLLGTGAGNVRYARDFSRRRRVLDEHGSMNRLYVVENAPSITGSVADHRLPIRAIDVQAGARQLAVALGLDVGVPAEAPLPAAWVTAVADDLRQHRGASLVVAGEYQPPEVHALAHAINETLGNVGQTVTYVEPISPPGDETQALRELAAEMEAGQVDVLIILGGNPVYDAPADLRFAAALQKVGLRIRMGLYDDETSDLCHWHIPEAHYLESWGDVRAYDGTVTILQPLIAPLYRGKTALEMLAAFTDKPDRTAYDIVREYWKERAGTGVIDFEQWWRRVLHDGIVPDSAAPAKTVAVRSVSFAKKAPEAPKSGTLELVFRPDPTIYDGRFSNVGWLQELPKPVTKLTWENVAMLSAATAERLEVSNEEIVELHFDGRSVRAPVWIVPGHARDSVTVHLGYGRTRAGRLGTGAGFDAYALRTTNALWAGTGVELRRTGERTWLATTQNHFSLEGRDLVRSTTLAELRQHPDGEHEEGAEHAGHDLSFYPSYEYKGYAWGMAIDLGTCIGCNACTIACQAENNIAVVGKDQVWRGREMHWIRIDRYYEGDLDNPTVYHQPLPCMQCENAPCEVVCPVNATNHSSEGLNQMVYNRCVGTKYCSNNCPYKVRRFNFYLYSNWDVESLKMVQNPDVTVRSRGVMEKCTYCVQRINAARIEAEKADRGIRDGDIVTACQQVCPTEAIVFGNLNDPQSHAAKLRANPRNYALLNETLNTRPRTTYLAGVRNPNPALAQEEGKA